MEAEGALRLGASADGGEHRCLPGRPVAAPSPPEPHHLCRQRGAAEKARPMDRPGGQGSGRKSGTVFVGVALNLAEDFVGRRWC